MKFFIILLALSFSIKSNAQVWSNDGEKIAFFYLHEIEDIYTVNADGSGFMIVDDHPDRDFSMTWSPSGNELIFTSVRDGHHELYQKNLVAGSLTKLTESNFNSEDASYAPNGSKIVFSNDKSGNHELYTMDLQSKKSTQLTDTPSFKEVSPKWSNDGSSILFVGSEGDKEWDVWTCDLNGRNRTNLTNTPNRGEFHPAWSPDGKFVSFVSVVDGVFEIHILNIEKNLDKVIVGKPGYQAFFPSWSPDGKWIAFTRDVMEGPVNGYPALYKINVENGEEVLITQKNSFHLYSDHPKN